ncbi:hypothetical protein C0J52_07080 [Blattella germanica]|nr:hypothetical protein C0J52_07080 [Blattella germanica]
MKTYSRKKQTSKADFDIIPMDFNEICRLCLSIEGEKSSIFENDVDIVSLPLRIMACLSVEVYEGDGLPAQLCKQCLEDLNYCYQFKQKCELSDSRLRQYLKNSTTIPQQSINLPQTPDVSQDSGSLLSQTEQIINNITDLETQKRLEMNASASGIDQNVNYNMAEQNQENVTLPEPSELKINHLTSQLTTLKKEKANAGNSVTETPRINIHVEEHSEFHDPVRVPEEQQPQNTQSGTVTDITTLQPMVQHFEQKQEQPPGLPFMCSKCPKRFAKRIDLRRHESVHDQQRGFECPICEKWFPNKTSFGRHERTHTGERPFSCEQCGKRFSQGAILARHIMTHTGVKPFKCEVCNKGFTQREGLRGHMRIHTKEQPEIQLHECPLCEKSFCHPSGLSRHLIIHTGKTFNCAICPKVFTDSSSLRRHMKRHGETGQQEAQEQNS